MSTKNYRLPKRETRKLYGFQKVGNSFPTQTSNTTLTQTDTTNTTITITTTHVFDWKPAAA